MSGAGSNREESEFQRDFGAALSRLRDTRGECPSSETLDLFHRGLLAPDEKDAVTRHVTLCGACDLILDRLQAFDAAEPSPPLAARLAALFRTPLPAYVLLAVALYPAYLGLFPPPQPAPQPPKTVTPATPPAHVARVFDLSATRGGDAPAVEPGPDGVFVLSFFVPVRPGVRFHASILDASGKPVLEPAEIAAPDPSGTLHLVCLRHRFAPGRYRVKVAETGGRIHEFPFTLR
jgi:hypothetical protein